MTRRQRQRTEQTRLAFLSAARTLFQEQGYARTTVADIARAADRAHGTFYLYFDNKHDVFSALLAGMGESITHHARELWKDDSSIVAIWLGVRDFFQVAQDNRDLWRLLEEMAAVDESAVVLRAKLRELFATRIQRGIELGPRGGIAGLDSKILAELLTAMAFRFVRTGQLPASADVTALHIALVWARGLGLPGGDLDRLRERVLGH